MAIVTLVTCTCGVCAVEVDALPEVVLVEGESFTSASYGGTTFVAELDEDTNILTMTEYRDLDNSVVSVVEIDMNDVYDTVSKETQSNSNGITPRLGKEDGTRIGYEHTFTNYEWEEYEFDGYEGDAFWWLRNPSADPEERSVYEGPIDGSVYSARLDAWVDAVGDINRSEGVVGAVFAISAASWLASKGILKLDAIYTGLLALGKEIGVIPTAGAVYTYSKAIDRCNTIWDEIF